MAKRIKTRSTYYQRQMSDEVKAKIAHISKQTGIAQWMIIENLLEKALSIKTDDTIDVAKFLKGNHSKSRTGKRQGK